LVNTSRGPIVDEDPLAAAPTSRSIAGAALDVFGTEPLPAGRPFARCRMWLATLHIGYATEDLYSRFYGE
jgi:phosphoglycerate dehydrogenase-like enzyme